MSKKDITKFSEVQAQQVPLLSELVDMTFVVEKFYVEDTGTFGDRATVSTDKGEYATFSQVLIQQLQAVEKAGKFPVEVTLRIDKRKRYHTFE